VLNPGQWETLKRLARGSDGASAQQLRPVNVNFIGTQYPNAEQMAAIQRELAMSLSGAS